MSESRDFLRGVAQFNHRDFFAAHETWELLWRSEVGALRGFHQGLIQLAVALHHAHARNRKGARSVLLKAVEHLQGCPATYGPVDIQDLLAQAQLLSHWLNASQSGDAPIPTVQLRLVA